MLIPCDQIQASLKSSLLLEASALKIKGKLGRLVSIVVGENPEQESYVKIKTRIGGELEITVEKHVLPEDITNTEIINKIKDICGEPGVAGIIIQQPIPKNLNIEQIYESIPKNHEIEGQQKNSTYIFPLVQACMIGLEWVYRTQKLGIINDTLNSFSLPVKANADLIVWLNTKNIVIAGNGVTTGFQIAKYFRNTGINFSQTDSKTIDANEIYKKADIIISGVGKKIISRENLKQDVILLNFGLHKEMVSLDGVWKSRLTGDYIESEIESVASIFTKTPGGLGPIDVMCLFGNFITACKTHAENSS